MKYIILNVLLSLAINLFGLPIHNIGKRIKDNYKILISLDNAANSVLIPEINYNLNYEENDQQELIIVTDHELEYLKCYIDELGPEPLILESKDGKIWNCRIYNFPDDYSFESIKLIGFDKNGTYYHNIKDPKTQHSYIEGAPESKDFNLSISVDSQNQEEDEDAINITKSHSIRMYEMKRQMIITPPGEKVCPITYDYDYFVVRQEKIENGKGTAKVKFNYPPLIDVNSINWRTFGTDSIVAHGTENTLPPGDYIIELVYNVCVNINVSFFVEGCNNLIGGLILPDCLSDKPPVDVSFEPTNEKKLVNIDWSDGKDGETFTTINSFGKYYVEVTDNLGCMTKEYFELDSVDFLDNIKYNVLKESENSYKVNLKLPEEMNAESWRWYIVLKADLDSDYPEDEFEYNKKTFLLQQAGTYLLKIITSEGCQYQKDLIIK